MLFAAAIAGAVAVPVRPVVAGEPARAFVRILRAVEIRGDRLQATDLWAWDLLREQRSAGLTRSWTRCFGQRVGDVPDPTLEFLRGAQPPE